MAILLLAFAGGIVYDFLLFNKSASTEAALRREIREYDSALAKDPNSEQVELAKRNNEQLDKRLQLLVKDLTRESAAIFKPLTVKEGFQLVEELRGIVNKWRRDAKARGIEVADDMDYSYKKYVAPNSIAPSSAAVAPIWKQVCVLDYILQKLYNCKTEQSPMSIISVQRELLKEEAVKEDPSKKRRTLRTRGPRNPITGDNFEVDKNVTARVPGSIDTLAYRFVFTGHTDILRRFLNQLKDFDAMLVVRSIDVKPAENSMDALGFGGGGLQSSGTSIEAIFGAAEAEAAAAEGEGENPESANRDPVVTDNISQFTVVVEYVDVIKDAPAKKASEANAKK